MTSLLAAVRKDFAATFGLHARTESVSFGAASSPRLKSTLRQSNSPLLFFTMLELPKLLELLRSGFYWLGWLGVFLRAVLTHPRQLSELSSVLAARAQGQEKPGGSVWRGEK